MAAYQSEDGSEFVSGPNVCGHNGSFKPYVHQPGPAGNTPPKAIKEKLEELRFRFAVQGATRPVA